MSTDGQYNMNTAEFCSQASVFKFVRILHKSFLVVLPVALSSTGPSFQGLH